MLRAPAVRRRSVVGKRARARRTEDKRIASWLRLEDPVFSRTITKAAARRGAICRALREQQERTAVLEKLVDGIVYGPGIWGQMAKAMHRAEQAEKEWRRRREEALNAMMLRAKAQWEAAGRPEVDIRGPVYHRVRKGICEDMDRSAVAWVEVGRG